MSEQEPSQATLFRSLLRKQEKQALQLAKLERNSARLDRRKARLTKLESGIADLERRLAEPRKDHLGELAPSDGTLRQARLIFNPSSGRDVEDNALRLSKVVSSLRAHGIEAHVGLKTSSGAARALAKKAVRAGHPLIVVAGGDGTIGDVAAELVGTSTVLGIVPIGTMNNLARSLGVPLGIDDACALIGMGTTRHIDVGRVCSSGIPNAEYFFECTGVGLGAISALSGQAFEKRHWRVIPRGLRKFFEAKLGTIRVEMDGVVVEAATRMVTVSNAPLMGNNMLAAPGAKMDDGWLDVQVYDGMGDVALMKHFLAASSPTPDDLKTYRARHVRITGEEPLLSNADMHIAPARRTIEIEVVPRAVSVIVGNGIALSVPVAAAPSAPTFAAAPPTTNGSGSPAAAVNPLSARK